MHNVRNLKIILPPDDKAQCSLSQTARNTPWRHVSWEDDRIENVKPARRHVSFEDLPNTTAASNHAVSVKPNRKDEKKPRTRGNSSNQNDFRLPSENLSCRQTADPSMQRQSKVSCGAGALRALMSAVGVRIFSR